MGQSSDMHVEIPMKVTAWVDEDVAPLVAALNELDGVLTLDSCQGDRNGPPAHVFFAYRGDERLAALFIAGLARQLAPHESAIDYVLAAEWRCGAAEPTFRLSCPAAQVGKLAAAIRGAESSRGMSCTELGS